MRETGGGFPGVRALGLDLPRAGVVQVTMNVEDLEAAALHEIVARIEREAVERGAEVVGSELVGLMPAGAAARRPARSCASTASTPRACSSCASSTRGAPRHPGATRLDRMRTRSTEPGR